MAPLFEHYGVQLRVPEAGGRVDFASEHDERAMTVLTRDQHPGADRDGRPDAGAGPVPGRAPGVTGTG